jgi:DNA-directed RNA polymerase specialized sigma subunit
MAKGRIPFSVIEEKADDDDNATDIVGSSRSDFDTWMDAVYYDLGEQDRIIMRHRSGYGDADVLDNNTIAERLGVSPAYVSQRAAAIQRKLDAYHG